MTNPTPDAEKLLPCPFCRGDARTQNCAGGGYEVVCLRCCATIFDESEIRAHELWNTRPQPAPPEGEPDAIIAELKLAIANAVEGDDPGSVVSVPLVVAQRILDRLSLAARPKVEDADEWLKSTELYRQWRDMKAKLAEREAELAQMQRERDGERETRERASDALMAKDEAIGVLIEIAGPQACQRAMDILDERRAARQQATKEKP